MTMVTLEQSSVMLAPSSSSVLSQVVTILGLVIRCLLSACW